MPRTPKPIGRAAWQKTLARLPRRPQLVIVGGTRPLGLYIRENHQTLQPQVAIWLETETEYIRAVQTLSPTVTTEESLNQALEALVAALAHPVPVPRPGAPQPGLPAKVVVNEAALAEAARDLLAPLGIPVEYAEQIPAFDAAFQTMSDALGAREEGPPEPFAWEVDEAVLPPLYAAAASYWRRAPWEYLGSDLPISIELGRYGPEAGVDTLYAVVLGNGGEVFGVAFYYALAGFERTLQQGLERWEEGEPETEDAATSAAIDEMIELLRQEGAPVDDVPPDELRRMVGSMLAAQEGGAEDGDDPASEEEYLASIEHSLVVYFDTAEDSDPFYREWVADHKLKLPARDAVPSFHRMVEHSGPIRPTRQEVVALTVALDALNAFFSAQRWSILLRYPPGLIVLPRTRTDRIEYVTRVNDPQVRGRKLEVRVSLPAADYTPS